MHMLAYYDGNTHTLTATLKDASTGNGVGGATVTYRLVDLAGKDIVVAGITWPLPMADQGSGVYAATVSHTLPLSEGRRARFRIVADVGGGEQAQAEPDAIGRRAE